MTLRLSCLPVVLAVACGPALAMPVYKCVSEGGKVTYSQNPCYGENWHRLGEQRAPRKPATPPAPAAAVKDAPGKAAPAAATAATAPAATAVATAPATAAAPAIPTRQ